MGLELVNEDYKIPSERTATETQEGFENMVQDIKKKFKKKTSLDDSAKDVNTDLERNIQVKKEVTKEGFDIISKDTKELEDNIKEIKYEFDIIGKGNIDAIAKEISTAL